MAGNTRFSGDTGYRGVVKLSKNGKQLDYTSANANMIILLATSGQFTQTHNPIFSTGDWGAGYMNISERVAYANNIIRVEGSMGCEVTAGDGFTAMQNFAFTNRGAANGTSLLIYPNGETGFQGVGWCTSLSFAMSQDAILTADMNWSSYIDGESNVITTGENHNTPYGATGTSGGNAAPPQDSDGNYLPFAYNSLYPYWGSSVYGANDTLYYDIMSWNAGYDSSIEMLKCCGTSNSHGDALLSTGTDINSAPVAPDYLGLGPMNATCSWEIFKLTGEFDYNMFHKEREATFLITTPMDGNTPGERLTGTHCYKIYLAKIVCDSNSSQIQTGNGWITASFNYSAIGNGKDAPMAIIPRNS